MWQRSKAPAACRTARCSSRMPRYWTGMYQPPNSTRRAPSRSCSARSGVCRRFAVSVIVLSSIVGRLLTGQARERSLDHLALAGVGGTSQRLVAREPGHLVVFRVVTAHVSPDRLHQIEGDRLV